MNKIVESVPNFSEGRRKEVVLAIVEEAKKIKDVHVIDWSMDHDHNRSVVTLIGDPDGMVDALFAMTKKAQELIDLTKHSGEHPRMGATDVIPFVPIRNISIKECIELSKRLGSKIAEELKIPVYLYEKSATKTERKNLSNIRKGQFEGFFEKIKSDEWIPDFGPQKVHPTAGVTAVGVREFLIAYNVYLNTTNVDIANKIAKAVRNISGGFKFVKALGFEIKERSAVQVSMNLTNFKKTPIFRVFETIKREALRYGVNVTSSEIIGLVPIQAFVDVADFYLQLENFDQSRIIENKLLDVLSEDENSN
jgi:glutamate formiminotransferase